MPRPKKKAAQKSVTKITKFATQPDINSIDPLRVESLETFKKLPKTTRRKAKDKALANLPKKKEGKPTEYCKEFCHLAYIATSEGGMTNPAIARMLDCSVNVLNEWRRRHPKFDEALTSGRDFWNSDQAENSLIKRVLGYTTHETTYEPKVTKAGKIVMEKDGITPQLVMTKRTEKHLPPETKAISMWLYNRQPDRWRRMKYVEMTGKDGSNLFPSLSDTELDAKIRLALKLQEQQMIADNGDETVTYEYDNDDTDG